MLKYLKYGIEKKERYQRRVKKHIRGNSTQILAWSLGMTERDWKTPLRVSATQIPQIERKCGAINEFIIFVPWDYSNGKDAKLNFHRDQVANT